MTESARNISVWRYVRQEIEEESVCMNERAGITMGHINTVLREKKVLSAAVSLARGVLMLAMHRYVQRCQHNCLVTNTSSWWNMKERAAMALSSRGANARQDVEIHPDSGEAHPLLIFKMATGWDTVMTFWFITLNKGQNSGGNEVWLAFCWKINGLNK